MDIFVNNLLYNYSTFYGDDIKELSLYEIIENEFQFHQPLDTQLNDFRLPILVGGTKSELLKTMTKIIKLEYYNSKYKNGLKSDYFDTGLRDIIESDYFTHSDINTNDLENLVNEIDNVDEIEIVDCYTILFAYLMLKVAKRTITLLEGMEKLKDINYKLACKIYKSDKFVKNIIYEKRNLFNSTPYNERVSINTFTEDMIDDNMYKINCIINKSLLLLAGSYFRHFIGDCELNTSAFIVGNFDYNISKNDYSCDNPDNFLEFYKQLLENKFKILKLRMDLILDTDNEDDIWRKIREAFDNTAYSINFYNKIYHHSDYISQIGTFGHSILGKLNWNDGKLIIDVLDLDYLYHTIITYKFDKNDLIFNEYTRDSYSNMIINGSDSIRIKTLKYSDDKTDCICIYHENDKNFKFHDFLDKLNDTDTYLNNIESFKMANAYDVAKYNELLNMVDPQTLDENTNKLLNLYRSDLEYDYCFMTSYIKESRLEDLEHLVKNIAAVDKFSGGSIEMNKLFIGNKNGIWWWIIIVVIVVIVVIKNRNKGFV